MRKSDLKVLLGNGNLKHTIAILVAIESQIQDRDLSDLILMQSAGYNNLQDQIARGLIDSKDAEVQRNKILNNLLNVIHELPDLDFHLPDELLLDASEPPARTQTQDGDKPAQINVWMIAIPLVLTLCFFAAGIYFKIFDNSGGNLARFIVLTGMGLCGAVVLFGYLRSTASFQGRLLQGKVKFSGPVVLFLGIVGGGYYLTTPGGILDVVVEIQAPEGHLQYLGGNGELTLELPSGPESKKIDQSGRAYFTGLPVELNGGQVKITFKCGNQPYYAKDSSYTLNANNRLIKVPVFLDHLDLIEGYVVDFQTNERIEGALISVRQDTCLTDKYGKFFLKIRPQLQRKYQTVECLKTGYIPWRMDSFPVHTQQVLPIPLTRIPIPRTKKR